MAEIFEKYIKVPEGAAKKLCISGTKAFVFFCVLNYSSTEDGCIMTVEQMADYLNMSRDSIENALKYLQGKGYIVKDSRRKRKYVGNSYRVTDYALDIINLKRLPILKQAKHTPPQKRGFDSPKIGRTNNGFDSPKIGQHNEAKSVEAESPILPFSSSENRTINKDNTSIYRESKEKVYSNSLDSIVSYSMQPPPAWFTYPTTFDEYQTLRRDWCQDLTAYEEEHGIYPTQYPNFKGLSEDQGKEESHFALWHIREHPELLAGEEWEVDGLKRIIKQYYNKTTKQ